MPDSESVPTHSPRRPDRRRSGDRRWGGRHGGRRLRGGRASRRGRSPRAGDGRRVPRADHPVGAVGSSDFAASGILTGLAGAHLSDLFEGTTTTIASALFTLTASGSLVSRVLDQSVHALDIAGTLSVYQRPHGGADFGQPASFSEGTEVARFDLTLQDVLAVFAPAQGLPTLSGDMRQTKAAALGGSLSGRRFGVERAAAAHAGDRDRRARRSGDAQRGARGRGQLVGRVAVRCRDAQPRSPSWVPASRPPAA